MQCIIALDGLSELDLASLLVHLPRSRRLFENLSITKLNFSSSAAQAAWAEVLTGKNIFTNGCAGYAHPTSSLNLLSVFTETDLLKPARLLEVKAEESAVTINIPLLLPKAPNRIWLSDGSLSLNKFVDPSQLRAEKIFQQYSPRPYKSHAGAATLSQPALIQRCLEIETDRLLCAISLFKRPNWSKFLYRLSIFDHLFHLLGLNYLAASDLIMFEPIKNFLAKFDDAIQLFSSEPALKLAFVSCYSHVACQGTLNLNLVLEQAGFLRLSSIETAAARTQVGRLKVAAAMWQPSTHYLTTLEGRLDTANTVAASPVSGGIHINKSAVFEDGIVADNDYKSVRSDVSNYLHNFLYAKYGNAFSLAVHSSDFNGTGAPDLIVKIDGVEFENLSESSAPVTPLTTHIAKGFAMFSQDLGSNKTEATDLATLLND